MAMAELPGPYDVRAYACVSRGVADQHLPDGAVSRRVAAGDHARDGAADGSRPRAAFGIDPLEIRRRNLIDAVSLHLGDRPGASTRARYRETMDMAVDALDVPAFRARQQRGARGRGAISASALPTFSERTGYGTPAFAARGMEVTPGWETVELAMDPSGYLEARIGASPHGQGLRTTLAQIIADELGIAPDRIRVVAWRYRPHALWLGHLRQPLAGDRRRRLPARRAQSARQAADDREPPARSRVRRHRARRRRGARRRHRPRACRSTTLARAAYHQSASLQRRDRRRACRRARPTTRPARSPMPATSPIVEVDIETGSVTIERFVVAEDAGRLINPMIVDGQIHGGVAQGIANALLEEIVYDDTGNILTATLADYLPPTCARNPADRAASPGDAERRVDHQRQGPRRGRRHRRAGGGAQRDQRCAGAVRRGDRRNAGDAATHPRGAAAGERRTAA